MNARIDQKNIIRYKEEADIKDGRSKSEFGMVRMSFNNSVFGDS